MHTVGGGEYISAQLILGNKIVNVRVTLSDNETKKKCFYLCFVGLHVAALTQILDDTKQHIHNVRIWVYGWGHFFSTCRAYVDLVFSMENTSDTNDEEEKQNNEFVLCSSIISLQIHSIQVFETCELNV